MDVWSIILAVVAILVATYYYIKKTYYGYYAKRGIPYAPAVPFLGSVWKAVLQQETFAQCVRDLYNIEPEAKYIGFYDLLTPVTVVRDLELLKSITVKNFDHFQNHRSMENNVLDDLFSKNLFALRDERWKEVRNLLSPAFTSSKMKAMFILMRDCAKRYGEILSTLPADQSTLELKDAFTRYTNDVIATCAFGVNVDSMTDRKNKFYVYGREATSFGRFQTLKFFMVRSLPWLARLLNVSIVRKEIAEFFKDLVATTIETRDEKGITRPDMIQLMMETRGKLGPGKELTIVDMTAQAFVFFFGGFESTSTLMCFAAYEVGINPEIQRRLQDEIDDVLENCNGEVTYDAISNMQYLDAVILEALRMYPVIIAVDRECTKPIELPPPLPGLKSHMVQKGDFIWIPIYGVQYDPRYFPEPDKFNPDRFLDDPKKILNSGTFLSFGLGPRMCIGNRFAMLEAKVLLFHVFARCNLKPCSKTTVPMVLSKAGFSLAPKNGFWFDIEPRKTERPLLVNSVSSSGVAC